MTPDHDEDDRVKCEGCWQRFFPELTISCPTCEERFCQGCFGDHQRNTARCAPEAPETTTA